MLPTTSALLWTRQTKNPKVEFLKKPDRSALPTAQHIVTPAQDHTARPQVSSVWWLATAGAGS